MSLIDTMAHFPWTKWKSLVRAVRTIRPIDFNWDAVPEAEVECTANELEAALRRSGHEGTIYAVKYSGEVLNVRRPIGIGTPDGYDGDSGPMERHLRARPHPTRDDAVLLSGHDEFSRFEEKERHLESHLEWLGEDELLAEVSR